MVGNKTAKKAKKNGINSTHHKKRTAKAKSSSTTKSSFKSKTSVDRDSEATKSTVSANTAAAVTGASQTIADSRTIATTTADPAAEAAKSKAYDNNCTGSTKAIAETTTGAVATPGERDDNLPQALPQSPATQKPDIIFVDSVNSFRYMSQWYCASKVLP